MEGTGPGNSEHRCSRHTSDYTAVVAAIRRLGLKLERYKGPVDFLVIDHFDKLVEN